VRATSSLVPFLFRFYAIVYPLKAKIISGKSRTRCIIAFTWIIALVLATPYLYCKSYAFNIESEYGTVRRQICTDRFDEIGSGHFRKGFFIFLFIFMYILPSAIIMYTCVHMTICLLRTVETEEGGNSLRRLEESKRKVWQLVFY
jgi:leucokinin receptor